VRKSYRHSVPRERVSALPHYGSVEIHKLGPNSGPDSSGLSPRLFTREARRAAVVLDRLFAQAKLLLAVCPFQLVALFRETFFGRS
jgi:hypothetical protein